MFFIQNRSLDRQPMSARMLFLSASAVALFAAGSDARAQSADEGADTVQDIVVTANRRGQNLQDVPISITALTAESTMQKGIQGVAALEQAVPSLIVARQANQAQPYLRGLGSSSGSPNAEPSVALYVDGVYNPSANANFFDFNNVERIEVLKGPQGTLFGRNASGGVVQLITKDPGNATEADIRIGYANYQTVTAQAYVSAPITDTLGANLAVLYKDQGEGWGTNLATGRDTVGEHNYGFRGKIVWTPGYDTTIRLSGDYSKTRNGAINGQNVPPSRSLNFPLILATGAGDPWPGEYNTNTNFEQRSVVESGGVSLKIEHDFGAVQAMSLSAYRETKGLWTLDQDLSPWQGLDAYLNQEGRMYSQEVHLLSPSSSKFQWLAGVFYFNYLAGNAPQRLQGNLLDPAFPGCAVADNCNPDSGLDLVSNTKATSFAVFAQGTYPILDSTNITLGVRYTWDKTRYNGATYLLGTTTPIPGLGEPDSGMFKNDDPTFRVAIDHKITPEIMVYASYNRGMKAGGFDISPLSPSRAADAPFQPETVNAYELGIKSELFGRKVRFNLGGFYYDFKNMQFQKIGLGGDSFTFNAPNGAEMYGVEAEIDARITRQLTLNSSIGYLHTRIRDFPGAPHTCLDTVSGLNDNGLYFCNGANGLPDPDNLIPFNAEGNRTPNSPELSFNAGLVYTIPSSVGDFTLAGATTYTSEYYFEVDNRTRNPSRWLFNGSIRWVSLDGHVNATLWGRNLTNKYYYTQYTGQGGASDIGSPAAPREYGITLGYLF